jgi:hypothetical protein
MRQAPKEADLGRMIREGMRPERREAAEFARLDGMMPDGAVREPGGPRGRRYPTGGRE